jgi:murein L,D-transpeptidase YcbB/YkuD
VRFSAVLLAVLPVALAAGAAARQDPGPPTPQPVALQLDLNVPSYQVDVYEGGVRTQRYRVAVGMPKYRTPRGSFEVTSIEWNPWWIPPDREWAKDEKPTPPCSANPMGRVKLNFRPLYFLHGTPAEASLGSAASHGCVRMANEDAIALARLVHTAGTPSLPPAVLDSLVADTSMTRLIPLDVPVPIVVRYDVAVVEQDTLVLYRDVYRLDRRSERQRAMDALASLGYDPDLIDLKKLSARLRATARRPLKVAVADLMAQP